MSEPRYLDEIELTGARALAREVLHAAIVAAVLVAAAGYFLPANRAVSADDVPFTSHYAEGGGWALVAFAILVGAWWRTRRRDYGAGYKLGLAAVLLPLASILPLASLAARKLDHAYGYQVFSFGIAATVGLGLLAIVGEPLFYIGERRHLERDVDPTFPAARVVPRRRADPG
ncbi:MAG: hypothetical protein KIT31_02105 [Deltaproteobacteria bacterium]|nr:hypothetical protein [Deltaproteobacteria bacterium]